MKNLDHLSESYQNLSFGECLFSLFCFSILRCNLQFYMEIEKQLDSYQEYTFLSLSLFLFLFLSLFLLV